MKESISPRGSFALTVWKDGKIIEQFQEDNLIVSLGRNNIAALLGGYGGSEIDRIGFGTSGSPTTLEDALLVDGFQKAIATATAGTSGRVEIAWTLETSEANGKTIREFALFNKDGDMFARKVREAIVKTADLRLTGTWTLIF
jgi:hypothetical protein